MTTLSEHIQTYYDRKLLNDMNMFMKKIERSNKYCDVIKGDRRLDKKQKRTLIDYACFDMYRIADEYYESYINNYNFIQNSPLYREFIN